MPTNPTIAIKDVRVTGVPSATQSIMPSKLSPYNVTAAGSTVGAGSILNGSIHYSDGVGVLILPDADDVVSAFPNLSVGDAFLLTVFNSGGGIMTLQQSAGASFTLGGAATVAIASAGIWVLHITSVTSGAETAVARRVVIA
jgi:hypothetical protein